MSYDNNFYEKYVNYLYESNVRKSHDWIFSLVMQDKRFDNVIDLGCGVFNEFRQFAKPTNYIGIDQNAILPNIQGDYRTCNLKSIIIQNNISSFVSLFSSEISANYVINYSFYKSLFEYTSIQVGLVSGFFYKSKRNQPTVEETGGIVSYQTIECISDVENSIFSEKRIILNVPSEMFGPDVFEVWKIFERIK